MPDLPVVLDVDGTLCFDGRTLEPPVVEALVGLGRTRPLTFASARAMRDLLPVIPPVLQHWPLVGANGAQRRADGVLTTRGFDPELRAALDAVVDASGATYFVDGPWDYASTGDPERPIFRQVDPARQARQVPREELESYVKLIVFTLDDALLKQLERLPVTLHVHEREGHLDVSPRGVDKAAAVADAGLGPGGFVAFGNDANDASLFAAAAYAVCVGDHPVGRAAHRVITRDEVPAALRSIS